MMWKLFSECGKLIEMTSYCLPAMNLVFVQFSAEWK